MHINCKYDVHSSCASFEYYHLSCTEHTHGKKSIAYSLHIRVIIAKTIVHFHSLSKLCRVLEETLQWCNSSWHITSYECPSLTFHTVRTFESISYRYTYFHITTKKQKCEWNRIHFKCGRFIVRALVWVFVWASDPHETYVSWCKS